MQYEAADQRPQGPERVDGFWAHETDARKNTEDEVLEEFAFKTPFRTIYGRISECSGGQTRALECVGSHPERHGTKCLFPAFSGGGPFEALTQLPIAPDRQEPTHLRKGVDFLRQQRFDFGRQVGRDYLIPMSRLVKNFPDREFRVEV